LRHSKGSPQRWQIFGGKPFLVFAFMGKKLVSVIGEARYENHQGLRPCLEFNLQHCDGCAGNRRSGT